MRCFRDIIFCVVLRDLVRTILGSTWCRDVQFRVLSEPLRRFHAVSGRPARHAPFHSIPVPVILCGLIPSQISSLSHRVTSHSLDSITFPFPSHPILFYPILFHPIAPTMSHFAPSFNISFHSILTTPIPFHSFPSLPIPSHLIPPHILPCCPARCVRC